MLSILSSIVSKIFEDNEYYLSNSFQRLHYYLKMLNLYNVYMHLYIKLKPISTTAFHVSMYHSIAQFIYKLDLL